jgi:hypothetical protein
MLLQMLAQGGFFVAGHGPLSPTPMHLGLERSQRAFLSYELANDRSADLKPRGDHFVTAFARLVSRDYPLAQIL